MIEFRGVATRPTHQNGLGLPPLVADAKIRAFESAFRLLTVTPDIYPAWKSLVSSTVVIGKQVHDARLVATCHVHSLTHVLTFNVAHFAALASCGPGIKVIDPATI